MDSFVGIDTRPDVRDHVPLSALVQVVKAPSEIYLGRTLPIQIARYTGPLGRKILVPGAASLVVVPRSVGVKIPGNILLHLASTAIACEGAGDAQTSETSA